MSLYRLTIAAALAALLSSPAQSEDGLKTSVAIDAGAQVGLHPGTSASDRMTIRGAEFMFYAPVDHLFDATLSIAAHDHSGVVEVTLHEAYFGSSKIVPRSRFRVGQFFLGIGRLNQFHQHDWPFITAPKVHQEFFADEGVLDTGLEYSYLLPTPFFLELTGGVTNGYVFGHDHSTGSAPQIPTHYLHLLSYFPMPWDGGAQLGLNYLGRKANDGTHMTLLGIDFTSKWKKEKHVEWLIQAEAWLQLVTTGSSTNQKAGYYIYPQYYLGENFYLGLRLDYYTFLTYPLANFNINLVPTLTYKVSEFAQLRVAYNHGYSFENTSYSIPDNFLEFQGIFILGAHPAHDF